MHYEGQLLAAKANLTKTYYGHTTALWVISLGGVSTENRLAVNQMILLVMVCLFAIAPLRVQQV